MTALLFAAQRLSAMVLAFAVAVHLATILYASHAGLTAGAILARTHGNVAFAAFYGLFVVAVAVHAPIGLRNVLARMDALARPHARSGAHPVRAAAAAARLPRRGRGVHA